MKSLFTSGVVAALTACLLTPASAQMQAYSAGSSGSGYRYPTTNASNYQFGNDPWTRPGYVANHMPAPRMQPPGTPSPSPSDLPGPMGGDAANQAGMPESGMIMNDGTGCPSCYGAGCNQCMGGCKACNGMGCGSCRGRLLGRRSLGRMHQFRPSGASYGSGWATSGSPWSTGVQSGASYAGKNGGCGGGKCGKSAGSCGCGCGIYGSVGGLYMNRDNSNALWLSFDTSNVGGQLLGTPHAEMDWSGGMEVRLGRYFDDQTAVEVTYWGVLSDLQEANAFDPAGAAALNTVFAFQGLDYQSAGNPILGWFDGALRHRLLRSYEFHNIEINLLSNQTTFMDCGRGNLFTWIFGIRYFKFSEGFEYWSDDVDNVFTGSPDEVYYQIDVQNHLVGFQLGGRMDFRRGRRWNYYAGAKAGLYANHITHTSFIGGASGAAFVNDPTSPYDGVSYDVASNRNDISMLAELDFGVQWNASNHWSTQFGYRAVGVTGVALTNTQVPQNFSDIGGVGSIDANGHLILHGAYANAVFSY